MVFILINVQFRLPLNNHYHQKIGAPNYYILAVYFMYALRKSFQYYYRAFILINGRQINYKYIIATNSFMCVITTCTLYNVL